MSTISSSSVFVSTPFVGRGSDANWYQENGVDTGLLDRWNNAVNTAFANAPMKLKGQAVVKAQLDFLNSLTPEQLSQKSGFTVGRATNSGNFTWQGMKDFTNAAQALEGKVDALMATGQDLNSPAVLVVTNLIGGMLDNKPGAFSNTMKYLNLNASSSEDQLTLSADAQAAVAMSAAAQLAPTIGGGSAPSSKRTAQALGTPAADAGASIALSTLTSILQKQKETASGNGKADETLSHVAGSPTNLLA